VKKLLRALAILTGVTLLVAPLGVSTPEYSNKENKQCVYCHTAKGQKDLNDAGKWYKDHDHSLKGYVEKKKPEPKPETRP
jgi:hypothetical protein